MNKKMNFSIEPSRGMFELTLKEDSKVIFVSYYNSVSECMSAVEERYPEITNISITGGGYVAQPTWTHPRAKKTLSEMTKHLILVGANTSGSFTEGYEYNFERFPIGESEEAHEFCKWIDSEIGGAGSANIDIFYGYWKYRDQLSVNEINYYEEKKAQVQRFAKLTQ